MARIRTIKPEFWTDEKIVQLPYEARLLFIGIWNFADDHGCLWDEPERIRMQVLPNDAVDISGLLDLLCASDLLEVYESSDEKRIFRVTHFNDHQKVDHPTPSKIPRESSRKLSIPNNVRRAIAKKYGCVPGGSNKAECYYCGSVGNITWWKNSKGDPGSWVSFSKLELDHLHPESKGVETSQDNIVLSCRECNRSKHDKDLMTFVMKSRDDSRTLAPEGKVMEGKGKEVLKEKNNKKENSKNLRDELSDVTDQTFHDFLKLRAAKKSPLTLRAIENIRSEALKAGITLETALIECCARGWVGFKAEWFIKTQTQNARASPSERDEFNKRQTEIAKHRLFGTGSTNERDITNEATAL
jgi:5-methylcytosine-specific restriction endonuclease McrA